MPHHLMVSVAFDRPKIQNQIVGIDDRNNWNDLQSNFCSVIIVSVSLR